MFPAFVFLVIFTMTYPFEVSKRSTSPKELSSLNAHLTILLFLPIVGKVSSSDLRFLTGVAVTPFSFARAVKSPDFAAC